MLRNVLIGLVLAVAVVAQSRSAYALGADRSPRQYGLRVFDVDAGLPQASVQAISQTGDGFLWFGTQEGLVRFDGFRMTVYDRRNSALRSGNVFRLLPEDGGVWVGTGGGGLSWVSGGGDSATWTRAKGLPADMVHALTRTPDRSLWIATSEGIAQMLPDRSLQSTILLPGERVWALETEDDGTVWAGTDTDLVRLRGGEAERFASADSPVRSLLRGRTGAIWVGTQAGLRKWEEGRLVSVLPGSPPAVLALAEDRDGSLWVGSEEGLFRLRKGRFERFDRGALGRERIWSILEDTDGSLWVGTLHGGVHQIVDAPVVTLSTDEGLGSPRAWSVLEASDGSIWVGTGGGGVTRVAPDGSTRTFTIRDGLGGDEVYALAEDREHAVWIGGRGTLARYGAGRLTDQTRLLQGIRSPVRAIHAAQDGALWFGLGTGGVIRWHSGHGERIGKAQGLSNESVFSLLGDPDGTMWLGTFGGGLMRVLGDAVTRFEAEEGAVNDVVLALARGADGSLWLGTNGGGLQRLRGGRLYTYGMGQGLVDDVVFAVVPDDARGSLWLSSNRGVARIRVSELDEIDRGERTAVVAEAWGKADGMRSAECNGGQQPAGWRTQDGRLLFPTTSGLAILRPESAALAPPPRPPRIEGVRIDGVARHGASLDVPRRANRLEFEYVAPTFRLAERVAYRHRLVGFDEGWVEVGERRTAQYTRVPAGRYRFEVAVSHSPGRWSAPATIWIRRRPRFVETWAFWGLCGVAASTGAFGAHRLRVRQLRQRERALEALVRERTQALAEANGRLAGEAAAARRLAEARAALVEELALKNEDLAAFSHSVSHDLRAPLRAIDGFSQALLEDQGPRLDGEGRRHLRLVREQAHRMREMIDAMLTLSRVGKVELRPEEVDVSALAATVVERLRAAHPARRVEVRIEDGLRATVDRALFLLVLENLVGNAWKFTSKREAATIEIGRLPGAQPGFVVRDDGAGFDPAHAARLFGTFERLHSVSDFEGTGVGLATVRRVIDRHGGRIWADGKVDGGAAFCFTLGDPAAIASRGNQGARSSP